MKPISVRVQSIISQIGLLDPRVGWMGYLLAHNFWPLAFQKPILSRASGRFTFSIQYHFICPKSYIHAQMLYMLPQL
jgi:hypothetical protein